MQAGDRGAFDAIVRDHQQQVFGYLLNRHRLTHDQALDLTQQTMSVALEKLLAGGEPVTQVRAWLFAIARLLVLERLRRDAREVPDDGAAFASLPDRVALTAFAEADRDLDRDLAVRRNLPTFLGLVHDAVESMPAKEREVIRIQLELAELDQLNLDRPSPQTIDALVARHGITRSEASRRIHDARRVLPEIAAALLMATTGRGNCPRLDHYLTAAGWAPGKPFEEDLRQRVRQHLSSCPECKQARDRALLQISALPVFVLFAVAGMADHRLRLAATAFATQTPLPTAAQDGGRPGGPADTHLPRTGADVVATLTRAPHRRRAATVTLVALLLAAAAGGAVASRSLSPAGAADTAPRSAVPATTDPLGRDQAQQTRPATPQTRGGPTATRDTNPLPRPTVSGPETSGGPSDSDPIVTSTTLDPPDPLDESPDPLDESPDPPDPSPVISEPRAEAVPCGLRITAYITNAETAHIVYSASDDTDAGPGSTEVSADLGFDGEIWSAVIYPNDQDGHEEPTTISWHIEASNAPYDAAPSDITESASSLCTSNW